MVKKHVDKVLNKIVNTSCLLLYKLLLGDLPNVDLEILANTIVKC